MKILINLKNSAIKLLLLFIIFGGLSIFNVRVIYSSNDSAAAATELYNQGKFEEALHAFESPPPSTAPEFFNVGNCHFRLGHWGQAYAYYEKALVLSPQNSDIRYNRDLVFRTVKDSGIIPDDLSLWTGKIIPFVRHVPEILIWLILVVVFLLETLFLYKKWKSTRTILGSPFKNTTIIGSLAVTASVIAILAISIVARQTPIGVIAVESAQGRSGPGPGFTELFRLPAGTKVEISGAPRDGWQQVRFSLGNIGWMLEKDFLRL